MSVLEAIIKLSPKTTQVRTIKPDDIFYYHFWVTLLYNIADLKFKKFLINLLIHIIECSFVKRYLKKNACKKI